MPKISDKRKQERKAQILKAAFKCFSEKGYELTSMREIFEEANLSAGAVYSYFDSKEEILRSLAMSGKGHFKRVINEASNEESHLLGVLKQLAFLIDHKGGDKGIRVDVSTLAASIHDSELRSLVRENVEHNITLISQLAKTEEKLQEHDINPKVIARLVIALIQGLSIQKMVDPKLSLEEIIRECHL